MDNKIAIITDNNEYLHWIDISKTMNPKKKTSKHRFQKTNGNKHKDYYNNLKQKKP